MLKRIPVVALMLAGAACTTPPQVVFPTPAEELMTPAERPQPMPPSIVLTAAAALNTVTENYAACRRTADRLDWLQAWVREQAAVK